jgi:hypothetical protein
MTISSRASDIRSRRPQAKIGQLAESSHHDRVRTVINSDPQAAQVSTVLVATAANSFEYIVTINGVEVSYTSDATATKLEIAEGLRAAINVEPLVRGQVEAEDDGVDTVTITGLYPGVSFTITDNTANLTTSTTTTAAEADSVAFGRLVVSGGYQSGEANELGILAASGAFVAMVDTLTVAFAAGERYLIDIEIEGERYKFAVDADTDTATTQAAIVAAINARMPANSVLAAGASPSVTLTAEVAGKAFVTSVGTESATVANLSLAHTTSGDDTDINALAIGVSVYTTDEANVTVEGNDVVYPANAGVLILDRGLIWVESEETVSRGDAVYVELGVSADYGKFFAASSSTRVLLSGAKWERDARSSSGDSLAVLKIDL